MTTASYLYQELYQIRRFEETVLENFPKGYFFGTTHVYIGQEANAIGVISLLGPNDVVFSNHRCHGHFLAYGGDPQALFAELMGKKTGVCGGRGGSQHLHWNNFYSNGIQGGIAPIATGMALAEKLRNTGAISVVFLGDGTLGEGIVYESLNLAALWKAPILFVVENNRIAQTTPVGLALSGNIPARFEAFGIPASELDSSDVLEIQSIAGRLIELVRKEKAPQALILQTCRFAPHSKGDDTRPVEEIIRMKQDRDPIMVHGARLSQAVRSAVEKDVDEKILHAFENAVQDPYPTEG